MKKNIVKIFRYMFNISIFTHDLMKEQNVEEIYIKNAKYSFFTHFLDDNDFKNYKFDTSYTFKFEKIPYKEAELIEAEKKLMSKYFNSQKSLAEIEEKAKNRIKELQPYHLQLTIEVEEDE